MEERGDKYDENKGGKAGEGLKKIILDALAQLATCQFTFKFIHNGIF